MMDDERMKRIEEFMQEAEAFLDAQGVKRPRIELRRPRRPICDWGAPQREARERLEQLRSQKPE